MRLIWTEPARDDLRDIHAYIARDSPLYARRWIERIKAAASRLRQIPKLGAPVEDWDRQDIREIVVGNYRVIYRPGVDKIEILRVIHGARQLPAVDDLLEAGNGDVGL